MHESVILRDDDKKFNPRYSFGELNEISIMGIWKRVYFFQGAGC